MVSRLDEALNSGYRKKETAAQTELSRPDTYDRLISTVEDQSQPVDLRRRTLLLAAHSHAYLKKLLPVLARHAGNPKSPLRAEALNALSGLPELERLDKDGYITISLATAARDKDDGLRLAATHGLVKLKSKAAIQALVEQLSDSSPMIRKLASARLKKLSGKDFGYVYSRNPASQAGAVERYRAWAGAYDPEK
jgi:hypothetical protein